MTRCFQGYLCIAIVLATNFTLLPAGRGQDRLQYLDVNLSFNKPVGFFSRKVPATRLGGQLGALFQLSPGSPLLLGGDLSYFTLGTGKARFTEWIDFRQTEVDYSTTSHVLGFSARCRFYPGVHVHRFDVFLEAQLGLKWLFTHTTATLAENTDVSDGFLERGGISPGYGAGAGFHLDLSETIFVQSRFLFLSGLSTKYYIRNSAQQAVVSSLDLFSLTSSPTDLMRLDVGIFIKLANSSNE